MPELNELDEHQIFRINLAMKAPPVPTGFIQDIINMGLWESAIYQDEITHRPYPKAAISKLSEEDQKLLKDWVKDPCFDLPEHLEDIQSDIEQHEWTTAHRRAVMKEKDQLDWSFYWADMVIHCSQTKYHFCHQPSDDERAFERQKARGE